MVVFGVELLGKLLGVGVMMIFKDYKVVYGYCRL